MKAIPVRSEAKQGLEDTLLLLETVVHSKFIFLLLIKSICIYENKK